MKNGAVCDRYFVWLNPAAMQEGFDSPINDHSLLSTFIKNKTVPYARVTSGSVCHRFDSGSQLCWDSSVGRAIEKVFCSFSPVLKKQQCRTEELLQPVKFEKRTLPDCCLLKINK
jgi:hypothetical protein